MSSVEETLRQRGQRYGDFSDHADIAQGLQDVMRKPFGWARLSNVQRQALTVIADKIARVLSGDPNYSDNWHDIQGYAKLAEDRLPANDNQAPTVWPIVPSPSGAGVRLCSCGMRPGMSCEIGAGCNDG